MASVIINSVIQKLVLLDLDHSVFDLREAYRRRSDIATLGMLRTFFLRGTIYRSRLSVESSASFSSFEQAIQEEMQRFLHILSLMTGKRYSTIYDFSRQIHRFKGEIDGLYADILECLSKSISSLPAGEFMEFFESLLENLVDIENLGNYSQSGSYEIFGTLAGELIFFTKFIFFAVSGGLEQKQLENFLIHCQVVGVKVARFSCVSWIDVDGNFDKDISELVEPIKPVCPQVRETYIQVLKAIKLSRSSLSLSTEVDREILGDFVDYLLGNLWEALFVYGISFVQSGKCQMQLCEGLQFLRNILRKQQEKINVLQEHAKDLIGAVITDAGILYFQYICTIRKKAQKRK